MVIVHLHSGYTGFGRGDVSPECACGENVEANFTEDTAGWKNLKVPRIGKRTFELTVTEKGATYKDKVFVYELTVTDNDSSLELIRHRY